MLNPAALHVRDRRPELMDDPAIDVALHRQALRGLSRINVVSRTAATFWPAIKSRALRQQSCQPLRVLDVACGGGDTLARLARRANRAKLNVEWYGCDISPTAVQQTALCVPSGSIFEHDILSGELPETYDVCINGLTLHHFDEADVITILVAMREASRVVVVSDLIRSVSGYAAAWLGTRLLSRSPVVHTDGPLSVRGAWSLNEMRGLAADAGMADATIETTFPYRMRLMWERS